MELKNYQKKVIADLTRYLEILNETGNIGSSYRKFWEEKNVTVGFGGLPARCAGYLLQSAYGRRKNISGL